MCRWMAWLGQPVLIDELLFKTPHGIVDQSLHSRMGAEPTNGDGFGLGWYGAGEGPGVYRSVSPAWATRTCASSPATSSRRCSSRTCAPRSARRCSRPTAIRSATTAGCSSTTATSPSSTPSGAISCSPSTRSCSPTSTARPTPRSCSTSRSRSGSSRIRSARSSRRSASSRRRPHGTASPARSRGRSASRTATSLWAVRYATEGTAADAVRVGRRRGDPQALSRQPAPTAPRRRRPAGRLRAVRRPARRVAGDPRGDGGDRAPRRRARSSSRSCRAPPDSPVAAADLASAPRLERAGGAALSEDRTGGRRTGRPPVRTPSRSGEPPRHRRGSGRRCGCASTPRVAASARRTAPSACSTWPAPVANANALAAWPEGSEREVGIRTCRASGTRSATRSGRRRRASGLATRFTTPLARAIDARPGRRRAAGRGRHGDRHRRRRRDPQARPVAAPRQGARPRSSAGVGVAATAA